jgi:LysM repeat protein
VLLVATILYRRLLEMSKFQRTILPRVATGLLILALLAGVWLPVHAQTAAHTILPGETLSEIAKQYGVSLDALMLANEITDADNIYSGQRLIIPTAGAAASSTLETSRVEPVVESPDLAATMPSVTSTATSTATYTVAPGDTLTAIARRFAVNIDLLRALNAIGDADNIQVGQVLQLNEATALTASSAPQVDTDPADAAAPLSDDDLPVADAAPDQLTDADNQPSQTLPATISELPIERSGNPLGSLNRTYTVRPGDTLNLIALRTGVDADALRRLNRFSSLSAPLSAGRDLLLPATGEELRTRTPAREYQVLPGETLSQIAAQHDVTLAALLQANRIADPNTVYPGQLLVIPGAAETNGPGALLSQIGSPRSGFFYYTVQPGDTMSEIARNLNTTMLAVQTYNNLPDTETVYNNMELKIPYGPPPLDLTLPPVPLSGTRFVVSLSRQQCWVYQGDRILYSWACSTGAGERRTKAGNYAVQSKILNAKSNVWKLDMPYWLGIYDVGPYENGIHGLPVAWQSGRKIWSGLIGQPATFGCAMLGDRDASTLFRLAFVGMPVHVIN